MKTTKTTKYKTLNDFFVKATKYKTLNEWAEARRQASLRHYYRHRDERRAKMKEYNKKHYKSHPRKYVKEVITPMHTFRWE